MTFFTLQPDLSGSYQEAAALISSRNTIVDKFLPKFINEKPYDTVHRYFNLLLVEYCEFLNEISRPKDSFSLEAVLEELADVVLYQASLDNELMKRIDLTEADKYYVREEIPEDRVYQYKVTDVTQLKFDIVFTAYFKDLFNNLIELYPDRKYHRGDTDALEINEVERTCKLIKNIETSTLQMVLSNVATLYMCYNDETESPVFVMEKFNNLLQHKIQVVNERLEQEYPDSSPTTPSYTGEPSTEDTLSGKYTTVLTETFQPETDNDSLPSSLSLEVMSISSEADVPIAGLTTWEAVFKYSGDIAEYNLLDFLKEADLEEDVHQGIYQIVPTPTTPFIPVEGEPATYKVGWIV